MKGCKAICMQQRFCLPTLDSNEIALASYTPLTQRGGERVTNCSVLSAQSSGLLILPSCPLHRQPDTPC